MGGVPFIPDKGQSATGKADQQAMLRGQLGGTRAQLPHRTFASSPVPSAVLCSPARPVPCSPSACNTLPPPLLQFNPVHPLRLCPA